jgi:copper chaperone CopZ
MKTPGVESVKCDVATKTVEVTGTASEEEILAAIQKTGKEVSRA